MLFIVGSSFALPSLCLSMAPLRAEMSSLTLPACTEEPLSVRIARGIVGEKHSSKRNLLIESESLVVRGRTLTFRHAAQIAATMNLYFDKFVLPALQTSTISRSLHVFACAMCIKADFGEVYFSLLENI